MAIQVFKRKELKFLITQDQKEKLCLFINNKMELDKHCLDNKPYLVRNVYMDTDNNDLIIKSIQKPHFKEKIRIRKYGEFNDGIDCYYLELKRKLDGIVYKRRISVTSRDLKEFNYHGYLNKKLDNFNNQVMKEISYFYSQYPIKNKTFLFYDRLGYVGKENKSLRLTFDSNLKYRCSDYNFDNQAFDNLIIKENEYILEIKFCGSMPLWLSKELSTLKIYHHSFSKIGESFVMEALC